MRSIQDPKKKKLTQKSPSVTSQDPDFPESLLSDINQRKSLNDSIAAYDRYMEKVKYLDEKGYDEVLDTENFEVADRFGSGYDPQNRTTYELANYKDVVYGGMTPSGVRFFNHEEGIPRLVAVFEKPKGYDEHKGIKQPASFTRPADLGELKPIGPRAIKTDYKQPEIIETPPTPMLTGRQAVQVGRVAQDRENARYGQVLDKEYYWDDDLKRWQMRPVDEERLGRPFPRTDRKYRLIKASF
jgi:hypothetical protein